ASPGWGGGACGAAGAPTGRSPLFAGGGPGAGRGAAALAFAPGAAPRAALPVVFPPLSLACLALGAIGLPLLWELVQRRRTRPRLVDPPPSAAPRQGPPGGPDASP